MSPNDELDILYAASGRPRLRRSICCEHCCAGLAEALGAAFGQQLPSHDFPCFDPHARKGFDRVLGMQSSAYERMQHLEQAHKVGWHDEDIAAIEAGGEALSDPRLKAVLAFVDSCFVGPDVPDSTFAAASSVLSHRDLATVISQP